MLGRFWSWWGGFLLFSREKGTPHPLPFRENPEGSNESFVLYLHKAVMRFMERCFKAKIVPKGFGSVFEP